MRLVSRTLLGALFALLVLGAGTRDDPALVYNASTVKFVFDDTYTALNVRLTRVEVEVLTEAGAAVATWSLPAPTLVNGAYEVPIFAQAQGLPNGTYQARLRVMDSYGNFSGWSEVLWASKQWRTIPTPGGCRTVAQ